MRLFWKEIKDLRSFAWFCLGAGAGVAATRAPLTFRATVLTDWALLLPLSGLLLGAASFSRETASRSVVFLHSRPVTWWRVAVAKVVTGAAIILLASVVTTAVYCAVCPAIYRPFLMRELLPGFGGLVALFGIPWAFGMMFSLVMPGAWQTLVVGALTFGIWFAAISVAMLVHQSFSTGPWIFFIPLAWMIGAAVILAARQMRPAKERLRLWTTCVLLGLLTGCAVEAFMTSTVTAEWNEANISPDGNCVCYSTIPSRGRPVTLVLGTRHATTALDTAAEYHILAWAPDSSLCMVQRTRTKAGPTDLLCVEVRRRRAVPLKPVIARGTIAPWNTVSALWSPDSRRCLLIVVADYPDAVLRLFDQRTTNLAILNALHATQDNLKETLQWLDPTHCIYRNDSERTLCIQDVVSGQRRAIAEWH